MTWQMMIDANCIIDDLNRAMERELRREAIKTNAQLFGLGGMDCHGGYIFRQPKIKKVIYNNPATIVLWNDGTKTVVKCMEGDTFSQEMGLAMCICKKALGENFHKTFHQWVDYG